MNKEPIDPPPAPTYAQSKQIEKAPRPSFPAAPPAKGKLNGVLCPKVYDVPKMRVNQALLWFARQKMLIPVSVLKSSELNICHISKKKNTYGAIYS